MELDGWPFETGDIDLGGSYAFGTANDGVDVWKDGASDTYGDTIGEELAAPGGVRIESIGLGPVSNAMGNGIPSVATVLDSSEPEGGELDGEESAPAPGPEYGEEAGFGANLGRPNVAEPIEGEPFDDGSLDNPFDFVASTYGAAFINGAA